MVRVIPVHNFSGQSVAAIEEPTAYCTARYADQEMVLLALSTHCVEAHELRMPQSRVIAIFPTVDSVNQMVHCNRENYIATVESKTSRDGTSVNSFVRIYVNWSLGGNQNQAMRARIAGRVTPSSNRQSNSLEMIELPLGGQPTRIACCQTTGNLLVAVGDSAILHELKVERQAMSKRKFIDFEAMPWSLGFSFSPTAMEIAEDFFLIMNSQKVMMFRLLNQLWEDIDLLSSSNSGSSCAINRSTGSGNSSQRSSGAFEGAKRPGESPLRVEKVREHHEDDTLNSIEESQRSNEPTRRMNSRQSSVLWNSSIPMHQIPDPSSYLDWDELVNEPPENEQFADNSPRENEKAGRNTIELPAIKAETHKPGPISNPLISSAPELDVVIKASSPSDGWSENYVVRRLLQLKISNSSQNSAEISEYFTCSFAKAIYLKNDSHPPNTKKCTLRSDKYKHFNGISCIICTTQEGYLFYFSSSNTKNMNIACTPYPFTAPVSHVALEETVLHALTEAGLESYTLRLSYNTGKSTKAEIQRLTDDEPVSLIGLRPFMGVQGLIHVNQYVVILTQAESHWTLYSLLLPCPEDLYYDILSAAMNHKTSSPSTYKHLLVEGYTIANLAKDIDYSVLDNGITGQTESNKCAQQLDVLFKKSCGLLADYYVNSESPLDWNLCVPYFKLSRMKISDILSQKSTLSAPGIGIYLTETLLGMKSGTEADALFQMHNVVDIIGSTGKKNLIRLIFRSAVLREYATEKLISILNSMELDDATKFAIVLLYVQADRQEQAENTIKSIADSCVSTMSLRYWQCLFDVTLERQTGHMIATFSDLSVILMRQKSAIFADILVKIIDARAISLHQILQIFLAHLPSRVGRDGHTAAATLQLFVETYLRSYFNSIGKLSGNKRDDIHYDYSIIEAFKILVRSYLGKLSQTNIYAIEDTRHDAGQRQNEEGYLFESFRPLYLDKMMNNCNQGLRSSEISKKPDKLMREEILKLQALLASGLLPDECLQEVQEFLKAHTINGDLSFRLLCTDNNDGTLLLMEHCPQALLQYAKERYNEESEWKYLVVLLYDKISTKTNDSNTFSLLNQALEDILVHLARTMTLKGLQRLLSNESTTILQRYGDICSQIMHADHVNSMIIGTGQHLLFNINV